jgi:hypothetical protein
MALRTLAVQLRKPLLACGIGWTWHVEHQYNQPKSIIDCSEMVPRNAKPQGLPGIMVGTATRHAMLVCCLDINSVHSSEDNQQMSLTVFMKQGQCCAPGSSALAKYI